MLMKTVFSNRAPQEEMSHMVLRNGSLHQEDDMPLLFYAAWGEGCRLTAGINYKWRQLGES
jgi:hypothetical protein